MNAPLEPRRSALARIVAAGLALISAGLAALVGAVAAPRSMNAARRWRRAAMPADVKTDGPFTAVIAARESDGWYETRKERVVFIDREGEEYRAFSATCTHLGCRVTWDAADTQFKCPCHGGIYGRDGAVLAGPPPRPLDRVAVRLNPDTSEIEVEL